MKYMKIWKDTTIISSTTKSKDIQIEICNGIRKIDEYYEII